MIPSASQFNKRVTIQQSTPSRGPSGQPIESWSDVATVWAGFVKATGREFVTAREVIPEMTHLIMIRYRAGVSSSMRLLMGSRAFDILSVENRQERNQVLYLSCKEGRSQGS